MPLDELYDAEAGVPADVRAELLAAAVTNGRISYLWLCRLYKRGVADAGGSWQQAIDVALRQA